MAWASVADRQPRRGCGLLWPSFNASDRTARLMGVGNVIARPSVAAPTWVNCVDKGKVVVGTLVRAHPKGDDDIEHGPGIVEGRDVSDYLVVERGVDKAAIKSGSDRRPGGRTDLRDCSMAARACGEQHA